MRLALLFGLMLLCGALPAAGFGDDSAIRAGFDGLKKRYPGLVKIRQLPGAAEAEYSVSLADSQANGPLPALLIVGALRGEQRLPAAACLEIARGLLEDADRRALLGRCEVLLIPVPNVGARALRDAKVDLAVAGVTLPFDDDRDGRKDEDGPRDLNGDGVISRMRVKRKGGRFRLSKHDARVLVEVGPGEVGSHDLYWEGEDDDGDGLINEDPRGTLRLANDWSIRWSDKQEGANRFMMQLPQTRALADFVIARQNIVIALCLQSVGGKLVAAPGPSARTGRAGRAGRAETKDLLSRDKKSAAAIVKLYGEITGRKPAKSAKKDGDGAGNLVDWLYESLGIQSFGLRLYELPGSAPKKREPPKEGEEPAARKDKRTAFEREQIAWLKYTPGDYLEWKTFKHPQLGDVEIGGWTIGSRHDPKEDVLSDLAETHTNFVAAILERLPRLEVSEVEAEKKGDGLYRIRLTLHNAGRIDYRHAFAVANRIGLPIFVKLKESKAVELISGTRRQRTESIDAGGTTRFEWFVRIADPASEIEFEIESRRTPGLIHRIAVNKCKELKTK